MLVNQFSGSVHGKAQSLGLIVIVAQHEFCDFFCHPGKQGISLFEGQFLSFHEMIEGNLDVDFMIRCIDTG